jgi:hypothetical protein
VATLSVHARADQAWPVDPDRLETETPPLDAGAVAVAPAEGLRLRAGRLAAVEVRLTL